ncbi:MAG: hypothetical protein ACKVQS_13335 [Fimbriimonadaceae bacterium]
MMKIVALCGLVLVSSASFAGEVVLDVRAGALNGSATLVNKLLPNGSKYVRLGMLLEDGNGKNVSVLQESTYDKEGKPVRLLQRTTLKGDAAAQSIVVTFNEKGASVKVDQGGKTATNFVPYPSGKTITATPEFWFIRDQVAGGGVRTYTRFDLATQSWKDISCTFLGSRDLKWVGKTIKANFVQMGEAKAYLDEFGDPYLIETPNGKMTRRAK